MKPAHGDGSGGVAAGVGEHGAVVDAGWEAAELNGAGRVGALSDRDQVEEAASAADAESDVGRVGADRGLRPRREESTAMVDIAELLEHRNIWRADIARAELA
jgi:hypothetical protein